MIFAVASFFVFAVIVALSAVGGAYASSVSHQLPLVYYVPLLLSAFAFAVSLGMFFRTRYVWHVSMMFWIVFSLFFAWCYTFMGVWHWMFYFEGGADWYKFLSIARILLLPSPFIYSVGCLVYFLTETPREYFRAN